MSRVKELNCSHAYFRAAERCGWRGKQDIHNEICTKTGLTYENDVDNERLRTFLKNRQKHTFRRIKYYKGYIFVFASASTKCYTVYPYPYENEPKKEDSNNDEQ